jgi:hypothetical protein
LGFSLFTVWNCVLDCFKACAFRNDTVGCHRDERWNVIARSCGAWQHVVARPAGSWQTRIVGR